MVLGYTLGNLAYGVVGHCEMEKSLVLEKEGHWFVYSGYEPLSACDTSLLRCRVRSRQYAWLCVYWLCRC